MATTRTKYINDGGADTFVVVVTSDASYTLVSSDRYVVVSPTAPGTIEALPAVPFVGEIHFVKVSTGSAFSIDVSGNGSSIDDGHVVLGTSRYTLYPGSIKGAAFVWSGAIWNVLPYDGGLLLPPDDIVLVSGSANNNISTPFAAGGRIVDLSGYPATFGTLTRTVTFFVDLQSTSGSATAFVQLHNDTDNEIVTGTVLSTQNTAPTEFSSVLTVGSSPGNLKTGKMYLVEIYTTGGLASDHVTITNARLVVTYA